MSGFTSYSALVVAAFCLFSCSGQMTLPGWDKPITEDHCYNYLCLQVSKTVKCSIPENTVDCPLCLKDLLKVNELANCMKGKTYTEKENTMLCNGSARYVQKEFREKCKACGGSDYLTEQCKKDDPTHADCKMQMAASIMMKSLKPPK